MAGQDALVIGLAGRLGIGRFWRGCGAAQPPIAGIGIALPVAGDFFFHGALE